MAGGAPVGNQNAVKTRPWRLAIERALTLKSRVERAEALDLIAIKVVETAMRGPSYEKGDPWLSAVTEVADRLDGKAVQSVEVSGDDRRDLFDAALLGTALELLRRLPAAAERVRQEREVEHEHAHEALSGPKP